MYADNNESRTSVSGDAVLLGETIVAWLSRTQRRCVTISSSEAEYIRLADTAKEVVAVE